MELEDLEKNTYYTDEDDYTELPRKFSQKCLKRNSVAETLDSLMELTLEHFHSCESSERLNEVFGILLEAFENRILTAYKSKLS